MPCGDEKMPLVQWVRLAVRIRITWLVERTSVSLLQLLAPCLLRCLAFVVPAREQRSCGGNWRHLVMGEHGVIRSPNYPRKYAANQTCLWKLRVRTTMRTLLLLLRCTCCHADHPNGFSRRESPFGLISFQGSFARLWGFALFVAATCFAFLTHTVPSSVLPGSFVHQDLVHVHRRPDGEMRGQ